MTIRKPRTNNLDSRMREKAEKLWRELVDCTNSAPEHCYRPGNEKCFEELHIKQALIEAYSEARNEALEEAANIALKYLSPSEEYVFTKRILALKTPEKK